MCNANLILNNNNTDLSVIPGFKKDGLWTTSMEPDIGKFLGRGSHRNHAMLGFHLSQLLDTSMSGQTQQSDS